MKIFISLAIGLLLSSISTYGQTGELTLPNQVNNVAIRNAVSLQLPENELYQLHDSQGDKLPLKISMLVVNNDTLKIKHIHVRGSSSTYFRRKCLNIKTYPKASFYMRSDTFHLSEFYAISMNMDRNYIRNKLALEVLSLLDVQIPANTYSNFIINDQSEGLYLVFYPPADFAMKKCNSPLVIRRGYDEAIDKLYLNGVDRKEEKALKQKYQSIYSSLHKKSGEALYLELSKILDLQSYFTWLAFNHLFQNADYADEVYFMWDSAKAKFEIIPWDFDDILQGKPHEGGEERQKRLSDKLIFSLEDKLDVRIAEDTYLYREYLKTYQHFLELFTPGKLADVLTKIYIEVYPYYMHEDIISQSQYDQYGRTDLSKLQNDLRKINQGIGTKIQITEKQIKELLKE